MNVEIPDEVRDETVETILDVLEEVRNDPTIVTKFSISRDADPIYRRGKMTPQKYIERSRTRKVQIEKPNKTVKIEVTNHE